MEVVIGVDVGNSTTEAVIAEICNGKCNFGKSCVVNTTGTKGTAENITGIIDAISELTDNGRIKIDKVLLNNAAPSIADFAMDTITETVITDSAMIGHNPDTPGGVGLGTGVTAMIDNISFNGVPQIIIVPEEYGYKSVSETINRAVKKGADIQGLILKNDEGTLVNNRLDITIPIVDEVKHLDKVPIGVKAAVEVAPTGKAIQTLSDPYGIAFSFNLDSSETERCRHIAKALIGCRSAVVIKTPKGEIKERIIPSGTVEIIGKRYSEKVPIENGAKKIMDAVKQIGEITDVKGEKATNIGGMLENVRIKMAEKSNVDKDNVYISDLLAVDSFASIKVNGGLAGESFFESGVAIAVMIQLNERFMKKVSEKLSQELGISVEVGGIEGEMALLGALTTPGTAEPVAVIDIGAGSSDVAVSDGSGNVKTLHLAGAGNLVTRLIQSELNIENPLTAELIKTKPLAKVENLFRIRHENGEVEFMKEPVDAALYGKNVVIENDVIQEIDVGMPIEKIAEIRKQAKEKVIIANIKRAIESIKLEGELRKSIILVGGSAKDFELVKLLTDHTGDLKIVAGRGNVRGCEGTRNAVATGMILKYAKGLADGN